MKHWICVTCGSQFAAREAAPESCPICTDQRQYVGPNGQQWTTLTAMAKNGFHNIFKEQEPGLLGIGTEPAFAIGQRALLVQTRQGNVLWDCISYLDDQSVAEVVQQGGIAAIAISHPHYYSSMVEWANHFDAPIYLHEADRQWVMRPDERVIFWSGETCPLASDLKLVRLGGHFQGGTVLHWPGGADGQGALLAGDIITVVADRRVSFMYSYPNLIPLPAFEIKRIRDTIAPYHFERLYGAWFDRVIPANAHQTVLYSANRYIDALEGKFPHL